MDSSFERNNPLVSIITVTYNSAQYLEDAIKSVINQSYQNIEYVIVDGGSTDGTLDVIKKYDKYITKWVSEPDNGVYDAMNKGIKMSTGVLIGILNSDDWYESESINTIVGEYLNSSETLVFHGDLKMIPLDGEFVGVLKPDKEYKKIWFRMPLNHPTCFVQKIAYERFGGYSLDFKVASDYDFILRLFKNRIQMRYIPRIITNMRLGGISCTSEEEGWNEMKSIAIKHGLPPIKANYYLYKKILKRRAKQFFEKIGLGMIVNIKRKLTNDKFWDRSSSQL